MIVYQLELKSKFRLMCEGGYINVQPRAMSLPLGVQSLNKYAKEGGYLSNLYQQETNVLVSH